MVNIGFLQIFSYPSFLTYVLSAQKNHLIETVLLDSHVVLKTTFE